MLTENLISINDFCINHKIDITFINSLQQFGLIEITTIEEAYFIDAAQLKQLEKMVHFHYELDINLEGIETITHLLNQINYMQDELTNLRNRLQFYELPMDL